MSRSVAMNVNILLRSLIKSVGVLYLMLSLSWKLTLLTFIKAPLIAITQKIYNTHYEQLSKEVQDSVARTNETAGEAVAGVRTVHSFCMEHGEACRYDNRLTDTHNLKTRRDTVRAVYLLVQRMMSLGMQFLMLYYGRQLIRSAHMSTGNLLSFILYQGDLGTYIRTLVYMYSDMMNSVGAAAKVFEYLDRKPLVSIDGSLHPETLAGQVHFNNLTFFYPTRPDQPALKKGNSNCRRICALHLTHPKCTHTEQWAAIYAAAPREQFGFWCLAQGHLSRGIAGPRLKPTTLGLGVKLSNH